MWERILLGIAGAAAPLVGLGLRNSRRNRLRAQAASYTELAKVIEADDPAGARELRHLVKELVRELVAAEHRALKRRLDVSMLLATILLTAPGLWVIYWAWGRDEWWRWLIILAAAVWTIATGYGGGSQILKAAEGEGDLTDDE